jgi:Tfp pilus assembly protein PilX
MKRGMNDARRRGATLVLVTVIGVILGILGLSMINLGYDARLLAVRDVQKVQARCAADAGLWEAYTRMQQKLIRAHQDLTAWTGPIDPDSGTLPATNADYNYHVDAHTGYWEIVSTGTCGTATKTVHGILDLDSYAEGIGVEDFIDAYNGTYFGFVGPGSIWDMKIRSNTTEDNAMLFMAWVQVDGDVFCGPGGLPEDVIDTKNTTRITGQCGASPSRMIWPDVTAPADCVAYTGPDLDHTMDLPYGRYVWDNLTIEKESVTDTVITILPHPYDPNEPTVIYVTDTLSLQQGTEIHVAAGAKLEVYIGVELNAGEDTGFSNDNTLAETLKIFGLPTCDTIILKTKSATYAVVYAPDADVSMNNSGDIYGSITANSFSIKQSGNFYFDTNLKNVTIDDILARFIISRWWES